MSLLYEPCALPSRGFEENVAFLVVIGGAGTAEVSHVPGEQGWGGTAGEVAKWSDEVPQDKILAEKAPRGIRRRRRGMQEPPKGGGRTNSREASAGKKAEQQTAGMRPLTRHPRGKARGVGGGP